MKRIVFFKGAYKTLDLFTEELQTICEKQGIETYMFDVNNYQQSLIGFAGFAQKPIDLVIAYNNLGFNLELVQGKNLWDELSIPFVNILVDHPFHYKNALDHAPRKSIILCIDRKHVDYINRFWPQIDKVFFMPHGSNEIENGKEWEERTIAVLYAGGLSVDLVNGLRPNMDEWTEFDGNDLIEWSVKKMIENHQLTTEFVIEEYLQLHSVKYDDQKLSEIITAFRIIDSYAVSYYREKVIEYLVSNGIKVTVYGRGWENRPCANNPNFMFGGYVKPQEILELMKDTKIVLNTMTWFKDGSHIRIYNGMLAGAVCMTDYSKYISEVINDGENGFIFELNQLDKLLVDIKQILSGIKNGGNIAKKGRELALKDHLLSKRLEYILELI